MARVKGARLAAPQKVPRQAPSDATGDAADDPPDEAADSALYRQERAAREQIRRQREALELEQLQGKLIDVDDASRAAFTAFRGLRDALENIPARIKDQVAAESDAFRVEQIIAAEITSVLSTFDVASAVSETDEDPEDEG
jgi:hypothetical protein